MRREGIASELLALQRNEMLVPSEAVKWARSHPDSELHAALEWDDEVAGEQYRIQQVRQLVAIFISPQHNVRQYVSLSVDRVEGGGYRTIESVMNAPDLRTIMLNDALHDLERVQAKYATLTELSKVWRVVEEVKKRPRGRPKAPAKKQAPRKR